jgi:hypothetical protein
VLKVCGSIEANRIKRAQIRSGSIALLYSRCLRSGSAPLPIRSKLTEESRSTVRYVCN